MEGSIRYLSKHGELGADNVLPELALVLKKDDIIRFYETLRSSGRWEQEWRGEFLAIFTSITDAELPPMQEDPRTGATFETPEHFRPPKTPLIIESDDDIPF